MTGLLLAITASYGVHLIFTALTRGWRGIGPGPRAARTGAVRHRTEQWLAQAGLGEVRPAEFLSVMGLLFVVSAALAYALFGGILPAFAVGARTVVVLKARLADPTADAACETLLVAHDLGGSDLDRRLGALVEDRIQDTQGRKDALAKQAGVRFARRFVLIVPIGMALAGMSVGNGRAAYQTPLGQVVVVAGVGMVIACWLWAGRIMQLPQEERVFHE